MALTATSLRNKICATCEYWSGEREAPKSRITIHADSHTPSLCMHPKNRNREMKALQRCSLWEQWALIQ